MRTYTEGYEAAMSIMMGRVNAALAEAERAKAALLKANLEVARLQSRDVRTRPHPEATPDDNMILRITVAYEQGFGHGAQARDLPNPYSLNTPEWKGWQTGYDLGLERRKHDGSL